MAATTYYSAFISSFFSKIGRFTGTSSGTFSIAFYSLGITLRVIWVFFAFDKRASLLLLLVPFLL